MASDLGYIKHYRGFLEKININHCWLIIGFSLIIRLIWISFNGLLVEEAYYWNYALHLDFSYYDHPPMVAVLIKISTLIFGTTNFGVHFPALFCWAITAVFIFKLTELISCGAGLYAVFLYAVLPYFFLQSNVTTPDVAVMVFWSGSLYYLYRSLVMNVSRCWYGVGVCLGLGMLSKYTIVLLGFPIVTYLIITPSARTWFSRKEPYIAALISVILFTPVIYWNATHEWASFVFQTVRRFKEPAPFSLPVFLGLLLLFTTPLGMMGLWKLLFRNKLDDLQISQNTLRFLQLFTLLPLAFFCFYSLNHKVKFDWIGPGLLPLLSWIALLINRAWVLSKNKYLNQWITTAGVLLCIYSGLILVTTMGVSTWIHQKFLNGYFSWADLTKTFNSLARQIEAQTKERPLFSTLDPYHIASELSFYQALLLSQGKIATNYQVVGNHIFGGNSLMYKYWANGEDLSGKTLILVSDHLQDFNLQSIRDISIENTPIQTIWSNSQRGHKKLVPFYYRVIKVKPHINLINK
jgi:dolichol-phosphate mannosyltransferase